MLFNKYVNYLKKFFSYPYLQIVFFINKISYKQKDFENKQDFFFETLNLNRKEGIQRIDSVKKILTHRTNDEMKSEHEILFSSISISKNFVINNILEIGTYDGYNALLLSRLFQNSKIDTIDLPESDKNFINFYNRKGKVEEFLKIRKNNLSANTNINFLTLNSLKLLNHKKKYDLIWVDGAHGYPFVCIDIINSLHLLNFEGIMACDDIYTNIDRSNSDMMYKSIASYETLKELEKQNLIKLKLIYKRLAPEYNCDKKERKFIAVVKKI